MAFGLYSLLYILFSFFTKKPFVEIIDESACKLIGFAGIIYILTWSLWMLFDYIESPAEERSEMLKQLFGKYWYAYWVQPLLWTATSQLLWIKKIRKLKLPRLFFSLVFIISIERFVILVPTLLRRNNLLGPIGFNIILLQLIFGILLKLLLFLTFVGIYYFVERKIRITKSAAKSDFT